MSTATNGRAKAGHFAPGNPGGPGRPRRAVEREYLRTVTDACPLDTWREIVEAAVTAARAGDAQARSFLAGHLIGKPGNRPPLAEMAAQDEAGTDPVSTRARHLATYAHLDG